MNTALNRRQFVCLSSLAAGTSSHALTALARRGVASFRPGLNANSFPEQLHANLADADKGLDFFGVCDFCAQEYCSTA